MKFVTTNYGNNKEILKYPDHYVATPAILDDAGIAVNEDGKKIVPAGTILGGGFLADKTIAAVKATTNTGVSNAEGVLLYDVDVTYGPASGAVVLHGFLDLNKLPVAPTAEEVTALKQITFLV